MSTISSLLTEVHREIDERYTEAENAAGRDEMDRCATHFALFRDLMNDHLTFEEDVLFPAFERETRMQGGPTRAMVSEHQQIREMMNELAAAIGAADAARFIEVGETMAIYLHQHDMKEENVLYPMLDKVLGADAEIVEQTLSHSEPGVGKGSEQAQAVLDVRGMEPPEPMERVLTGLSSLAAGEKLLMIIDREPRPLYRILERNGYVYDAQFKPPGTFEILIWQKS